MTNNYTNAKKILPPLVFSEVQACVPEGGLLYIQPERFKAGEIGEQIVMLDEIGMQPKDIAKKVGRSVRRVNQVLNKNKKRGDK